MGPWSEMALWDVTCVLGVSGVCTRQVVRGEGILSYPLVRESVVLDSASTTRYDGSRRPKDSCKGNESGVQTHTQVPDLSKSLSLSVDSGSRIKTFLSSFLKFVGSGTDVTIVSNE